MKINARLSSALFDLPPDGASLPRLNLHRGRALGLPAGRDVAHAIGTEPLTEEQLLLDELAPDDSRALMRATPLWFYVLCEAQALAGGKHLGPVGGTIVAEVLTGILEGDLSSYLRQWPTWTPRLPGEDEDPHFTMAKLVQFARPAQH
jgi:hypothetical protein